MTAIVVMILTGVDHVESADPERDPAVSSKIRGSSDPRTAIQAAAGAIPRANPRNRCDQRVNRLL